MTNSCTQELITQKCQCIALQNISIWVSTAAMFITKPRNSPVPFNGWMVNQTMVVPFQTLECCLALKRMSNWHTQQLEWFSRDLHWLGKRKSKPSGLQFLQCWDGTQGLVPARLRSEACPSSLQNYRHRRQINGCWWPGMRPMKRSWYGSEGSTVGPSWWGTYVSWLYQHQSGVYGIVLLFMERKWVKGTRSLCSIYYN